MNIRFILSDLYYYFYFKISYLKYNFKGVRVTSSCRIEATAILAPGSSFFGRTIINGNVSVGQFTYVTDSTIQNASIGKLCSIAPGVKIGLNEHPLKEPLLHPLGYDSRQFNHSIPRVIIENDVWIGANAVILSGVRIGNGAVVAAGAVITKDVAPFTIVGGVPGKVIGQREKHRLFEQLVDTKSADEIRAAIARKNI